MRASDRTIPEWFNRIRSGQLTLPRFQRSVAWSHGTVSELLTTVLQGLPAGAALVLAVGNQEIFKSRHMVGAPSTGEGATEQLLDGQQRLTALWCSMHDKYEDRTYLVRYRAESTQDDELIPHAYGQTRWTRQDALYPKWVDSPRECREKGYIPFRLIRPDADDNEVNEWISQSYPEHATAEQKLSSQEEIMTIINQLKTIVREFNIPYLELPNTTSKEVALNVFIKMNTSSVKLSAYDIVVALVEGKTDKSLKEHVDQLIDEVPRIAEITADPSELILDVATLLQDRVPSQAGYRRLDFVKLISSWSQLISGIGNMIEFLEQEGIFDKQRLPSYPAIPVIAALWRHIPDQPDQRGNARRVVRKYLWRSFLSSRYEQSTASNSLKDFRGLKRVIEGTGTEVDVPIFDEDEYPAPSAEKIVKAEWPKRRTILGRGLLALQIRCGAEDLADGTVASSGTISSKDNQREYHHLFPVSLLEDADVPDDKFNLAANCALITGRTNRLIGKKAPLDYLKERADGSVLGEDELRWRLVTHLIPYEELAVGYEKPSEAQQLTEEQKAKVRADYDAFLRARSEVLALVARQAWDGTSVRAEHAKAALAEYASRRTES